MKKKITPHCVLLIVLLAIFPALNAQQSAEKYVIETDYLLYLPDGYKAADTITKWPVLMFLHGAGETGNDIEKVKAHGPAKLIEQGKKFPFIVISPQTRTHGWKNNQLMELLKDVTEKYNTDLERLYLTGLSMGGFGTWNLAAEYPIFAAIIPICGGGDPSTAFKLRHMPIWCFHGDKDDIVPIWRSTQMVNAVKKFNPDIKYTIYPDVNHDSWTQTYENDVIYDWLLQHKKFEYKEIELDESVLSKYTGRYDDNNGEKFDVVLKEGKLYFVMEGISSNPQLRPASEKEFFVFEKDLTSLVFEEENGNISGAHIYADKDMYYSKK